MSRSGLGLVAVALMAVAVTAQAQRSGDVVAGQRIAERNCSACHAVAGGASPLAKAPPFRDLHKRYRAGGLGQLLQEGMIAPETPPEEGSPRRHPIMPMASLGPDEVAELTAYLKSLEPAAARH